MPGTHTCMSTWHIIEVYNNNYSPNVIHYITFRRPALDEANDQ